MKWERVQVKIKARETPDKTPEIRRGGTHGPGRKWGHTCNAVKRGRLIYVFGGYGRDDCQTNDVHVFDTTKQTWSKPLVKGSPPSPRDSHTCTTVGNRLFVFGGTDGTSPLNDLYILDTDSNSWSSPPIKGEGPAAREGHSAALIGTRLFVFGGCGRSSDDLEETYFNDVYILDTGSLTWTKAATHGTPPAPRDSHTFSSYRNKFIVLGGEDSSNSYLSDIYILDADTLAWKELKTSGQKLIPRAGHTTVALGKYLFVFGGFTDDRKLFDDLHVLNVESGLWTKATTNGAGPSPRFSLAGDCAEPEKGILLFIGGCNENLEALDDMYYLDTELKLEKSDGDAKPEKLSLKKELKRKQQELLLNPEKIKDNNGSALDESSRSCIKKQQEVVVDPEKTKDNSSALDERVKSCDTSSPLVTNPETSPNKLSFHDYKPVLERNFEAKVTNMFHYGYSVEANIDGKHLRGLVFSYKPGYAGAVHNHLQKKKLLDEQADAKMRELRRSERRLARQAKQQLKRAAEVPSPPEVPLPENVGICSSVDQAVISSRQGLPTTSPTVPALTGQSGVVPSVKFSPVVPANVAIPSVAPSSAAPSSAAPSSAAPSSAAPSIAAPSSLGEAKVTPPISKESASLGEAKATPTPVCKGSASQGEAKATPPVTKLGSASQGDAKTTPGSKGSADAKRTLFGTKGDNSNLPTSAKTKKVKKKN